MSYLQDSERTGWNYTGSSPKLQVMLHISHVLLSGMWKYALTHSLFSSLLPLQCRSKRRQFVWMGFNNFGSTRISLWRWSFLLGHPFLSWVSFQTPQGEAQKLIYLSSTTVIVRDAFWFSLFSTASIVVILCNVLLSNTFYICSGNVPY